MRPTIRGVDAPPPACSGGDGGSSLKLLGGHGPRRSYLSV